MADILKVLIANRAEIVVRIARTLREMGIRSVAVYSEVDAAAPHVLACDEAVCIGPAAAGESYLNVDAILDAARKTGADAVHPGYGFLAENASFAEACVQAGLTFIGPSPEAIRTMGSKTEARAAAIAAGVPVVPGSDAVDSDEALLAAVREIGLPVMLKAAAGGGGKGMRRIEREDGIESEIASARREAEAAFDDGRLYVERSIEGPRHIEIQIVGDAHGHVLPLGERECSLQRRFQKVVEESPSPAVDAGLRGKLQEAAVRLAEEVGYVNAGTVEFLLAPEGDFYFLEMNTRLQVEHPVTECVTGLDLVRLQIEAARGERLPETPPPPRGHAIEVRLYAEDPAAGFLPASGKILKLDWPGGIRVDHALAEGMEVGSHYDPMLAKLIAYAPDREQARRRLVAALRETVLLGLPTNQTWLIGLLETEAFRTGAIATDRLPEIPELEPPAAFWVAASTVHPGRTNTGTELTPWERLGHWRIGG